MRPLFLFAIAAACGYAQAPATPPAGSTFTPQKSGLYAVFNTSMGTITAELFEKDAPITVANFVALARGTKPWKDPNTGAMVAKPLYNNITFHRVIPNFMIQTGDPTATGSHDCGFTIRDEVLPGLKFDRPGRLGMANTGRPNSGGCQFFITEVPTPFLDPPQGTYSIFGQVVDGQDLVAKIARVPRDRNDKPNTPVRLISVTIKRVGPEPEAKAPKKAPAKE
jgi:peptidyl-prolyl cis-trans isomerase A (cyclophilin A)